MYCTWWTTCRSAVDAPWHDLYLYQNLLKYKQVSPEISHSATKALNRHLWHLCSKMIPLTLFSDIASKPELTNTELIGKFTAVHIILMKSRVIIRPHGLNQQWPYAKHVPLVDSRYSVKYYKNIIIPNGST